MSKERIRADISAFTKALVKITKLSTRQKRKIGQFAINMIRKRTRRGFGVNPTSKRQQRLKRLASSTIKTRKAAKRLSKFASPGKSNLSFTGQMIQSLGVIRSSGSKIILGPRKTRTGKQKGTNQKVVDNVTKARPFLDLTTGEDRKLGKFLESNFAKQLKKI